MDQDTLRFKTLPAARLYLLLTGTLLLIGCGGDLPPLGKVQGTVTLNGKPLNKATLSFQTEDGKGRQSWGVTDEQGHYELVYLRDILGAKVGKNRVVIRTVGPEAPQKEILPARYNSKTELQADVKPNENPPFDFDLMSR